MCKILSNEEAIKLLKEIASGREDAIEQGYLPIVSKYYDAFDMAIKALENISYLTDRPCDVCEFHKENGCCKWDCVFENV